MKPPLLRVRPTLSAFAKELRAARIHSGLSRSELARRASMTRQAILKIEQTGNATLSTIVLLADALGCQVSDLFPRKAPWHRLD
jgi:transcriptional regulator with XRE-family HTH domain